MARGDPPDPNRDREGNRAARLMLCTALAGLATALVELLRALQGT